MSFNDFRKKEAEKKKDAEEKPAQASPYRRTFDNAPGKAKNVDRVNTPSSYRRPKG
jgi:hypothetical protein